MRECLPPRVQHGHEAQLSAKVFGVGAYTQQGLRGGPEQEVVDHLLILQGQGRELARECEDDMVILDGRASRHRALSRFWHFGQWRFRQEL